MAKQTAKDGKSKAPELKIPAPNLKLMGTVKRNEKPKGTAKR